MPPVALLRRLLSSLPWRRGHRRTRTMLGIDWRLFGSAVHHLSTVGDVSPGGVFVPTASPAPAGSPVVLDLQTLDGRVELGVHARVAWSGPHGMGLRFTRAPRGA